MKKNTNSNEPTTKGLRPNPMSERVSSIADTQKSSQDFEVFGEVTHTYTRAEAIAKGILVEVSDTAKRCELPMPVFITAGVYYLLVHVPQHVKHLSETGNLWWLLSNLHQRIKTNREPGSMFKFDLVARINNERIGKANLRVWMGCLDKSDPTPTILISLAEED